MKLSISLYRVWWRKTLLYIHVHADSTQVQYTPKVQLRVLLMVKLVWCQLQRQPDTSCNVSLIVGSNVTLILAPCPGLPLLKIVGLAVSSSVMLCSFKYLASVLSPYI